MNVDCLYLSLLGEGKSHKKYEFLRTIGTVVTLALFFSG
jgi:hypothetical protein